MESMTAGTSSVFPSLEVASKRWRETKRGHPAGFSTAGAEQGLAAGVAPAAFREHPEPAETGSVKRRRKKCGTLANEFLVDPATVPKLAMLPQEVSWSLTREAPTPRAAQQTKHLQRFPSQWPSCVRGSLSGGKPEKVESGSLPPSSVDTFLDRNVLTTSNNDEIPDGSSNPICSCERLTRMSRKTALTDNWCPGDQRDDALGFGEPGPGVTKRFRGPLTAAQKSLPLVENSCTSENLHRALNQMHPHTAEILLSLHDSLPQTHRIPPCCLQTTTGPAGSGIDRTTRQKNSSLRRFRPSLAMRPRATASSVCTWRRGRRPWSAQYLPLGNESGAANTNVKWSTPRPHTVDAGFRMLRLRWQRRARGSYHEYDNVSRSALRGNTLLASWLGAAPGEPAAEAAAAEALEALAKQVTPTAQTRRRQGEMFKVQGRSETSLTSIPSPCFVENDGLRPEPRVVCSEGSLRLGLTAEALGKSGVVLNRSGRVTIVNQYMLAFDEIWAADIPALRPIRLDLPRPSVIDERGPVYLMPMHRRGKGIEGRTETLFPEPPPAARDSDSVTAQRDKFCFEDESRYDRAKAGARVGKSSSSAPQRRWRICKLWATGVETWQWEWSPEAQMMLGRLALWRGVRLISRTHAIITVFGVGMAGRVVVEGAQTPRGVVIEAYVAASSETCYLPLSVEDLQIFFACEKDKLEVGMKNAMLEELVKMIYFDYTVQLEVKDMTSPGGIRLQSHHYSDRESWSCLEGRRQSDYDLHWESRETNVRLTGNIGNGDTIGCSNSERVLADIESVKPTGAAGGIDQGKRGLKPTRVLNVKDGDPDNRPREAPAFANKHSSSLDESDSLGGTAVVNATPSLNETNDESLSSQPLGGTTAALGVSGASIKEIMQAPHLVGASIPSNDLINSASIPNVGAGASRGVVSSNKYFLQNRSRTRRVVHGESRTHGVHRQTFAKAYGGRVPGERDRPLDERAVWITQTLRAGMNHNLSLSQVQAPNSVQIESTTRPAEQSLGRSQHVSKRLSSVFGKGAGSGATPTCYRPDVSSSKASAASSTVRSPNGRTAALTRRSNGQEIETPKLARNDTVKISFTCRITTDGEKHSSGGVIIPPVEDASDVVGTDDFGSGSPRNMLEKRSALGGNRRVTSLRAKPWDTIRAWTKAKKGRDDGRLRVKAFDLLVDIYKKQQREAEAQKEANLKAWLAIKKRLRGLTLGTVVRVSGRLLTLMVYEPSDQPGNCKMTLWHPPSGGTFSVTVGVRTIAQASLVRSPPEEWTLRQRRRIFRQVIRKQCQLVPVEEGDADGEKCFREARTRMERAPGNNEIEGEQGRGENEGEKYTDVLDTQKKSVAGGKKRLFVCVIRCLGRDSTTASVPDLSTAPESMRVLYSRRRHQLQQPPLKDHRLAWKRNANVDPIPNENGEQQMSELSNHSEGGRQDREPGPAEQNVFRRTPFRGKRPRRECGRGVRHTPVGFCAPLLGHVAPDTTFTIFLNLDDVAMLTKGTDLLEAAEQWNAAGPVGQEGEPDGFFPPAALQNSGLVVDQASFQLAPVDSSSGAGSVEGGSVLSRLTDHNNEYSWNGHGAENEQDSDDVTLHIGDKLPAGLPVELSQSQQPTDDLVGAGGDDVRKKDDSISSLRSPQKPLYRGQSTAQEFVALCSEEAWDLVARQILSQCYWMIPATAHPASAQETELHLDSTDEPIFAELSGTTSALDAGHTFINTNLRLAVATCIFRRVLKVMGTGRVYCQPMLLLVVVSQWHERLVVRCYDFASGNIREAERPDPVADKALIQEFRGLSEGLRDIQLQVTLANLVVFDVVDDEELLPSAECSDAVSAQPPQRSSVRTWGVRFDESGSGALVIDDAGIRMYDDQVAQQMAAASAQVDKRVEDTKKGQLAAREKDKKSNEKRLKREAKRRAKIAKSGIRGRRGRGGGGSGGGKAREKDSAGNDGSEDDDSSGGSDWG